MSELTMLMEEKIIIRILSLLAAERLISIEEELQCKEMLRKETI